MKGIPFEIGKILIGRAECIISILENHYSEMISNGEHICYVYHGERRSRSNLVVMPSKIRGDTDLLENSVLVVIWYIPVKYMLLKLLEVLLCRQEKIFYLV